MDEKDWEAMQVLHEEKNISRASERLYISQPALTYRLKNLEEDMGTKLFFKTKKGIELTAEGVYLAQYADEMITKLQNAKDYIQNMNQEIQGILRLGVSSNFAQYKLPALLKEFITAHPKVQFSVNTGWSADVMGLLNSSEVHLGILRGDYNWTGSKSLLHTEQLFLISKNEVNMEEVPELPFINYKTDSSLKDIINKWWHDQYNEPPIITMETDRQETCKEMVKNDLGIAILPEICLRPSDEIHKYPLFYKDGEPVMRDTWLMYNHEFLKLSTVQKFVEFLKNHPSLLSEV
ncbi:LysR family transcriptional regulator [Planococcus rifietoensis]|uniref:LysR family transcriptional regulator n=1 Tax=Planococcus rifietoensis TaxID=200991 RepID=A0A0U2Z9F4_9BACL|nr:LysR family transcriptional regulator [Planococcus rifietoensis]ALS75836.1 LysR family transcriptional regulator [Planococcus rifietoensis]